MHISHITLLYKYGKNMQDFFQVFFLGTIRRDS